MNKTKEKSFLSHAAIYGFGTLLLQLSGLILLPIYVNYLSPAEFGILDIIDRIGMILLIGLMANGFRMATLTFFRQAETDEEREKVAITVSTALFGTIFVGLVLAAIFTPSLSGWLGIDDQWLMLFGIATGLTESILIIPMALMQARLQSTRFVYVSMTMFVVRLVSLLVMVVGFGWGLWGILAARMINSILFGLWLYADEVRRSSSLPDWKTMEEVFWFALPFLPGGLLAFFLGFGDRFFLIRLSGEEELGFYAMGFRLVGMIPALSVGPMYKVWSATMYDAAKQPDAANIFGRVFTRIMFSFVFVAFGLALFAGDALRIVGGHEYLPGLVVLVPLIITGFLGKSADLIDAGFYIERKTKYKPWILLASGIAALISFFLLIPGYGMMGAAWSLAICKLVHCGLTYFITQKIFPVNYEWGRLAGMVVAASLLYALSRVYAEYQFRFLLDVMMVFALAGVCWYLATPFERGYVTDMIRNQLNRFPAIQRAIGLSR